MASQQLLEARPVPQRAEVGILRQPSPAMGRCARHRPLQDVHGKLELAQAAIGAGDIVLHRMIVGLERQGARGEAQGALPIAQTDQRRRRRVGGTPAFRLALQLALGPCEQ